MSTPSTSVEMFILALLKFDRLPSMPVDGLEVEIANDQKDDFMVKFSAGSLWPRRRARVSCPGIRVERLLGDRIAERLRAAQGVLAMGKRYGAARLEAACQRALAHDSPHYRTVKTILATGADQQPLQQPQTPAAYGRARFTRSAADLFGAELNTIH